MKLMKCFTAVKHENHNRYSYFLRALYEPEKISKNKLQELESLSSTILVSSITIVEIMIKNSIGKLAVKSDLLKAVEDSGFEFLAFNAHDAITLGSMPSHHTTKTPLIDC